MKWGCENDMFVIVWKCWQVSRNGTNELGFGKAIQMVGDLVFFNGIKCYNDITSLWGVYVDLRSELPQSFN